MAKRKINLMAYVGNDGDDVIVFLPSKKEETDESFFVGTNRNKEDYDLEEYCNGYVTFFSSLRRKYY